MKFFLDNMWLFALAALSGGTLLWPVLQRRGANVSLLQATQMINQGKTILLDVRDPTEFATGHVRDAKNIPLAELSQRVGELDKFKAKSVVVICQSGVRSARALSTLKKAGFVDVFSLSGGLAAWQAQGLPVAK